MNRWDTRFLRLADEVSTWSRDPSSQVGAVIVRPDKTVASLGFNGFPRGCRDDKSLYENRETKYQRIIHAETNAILSHRASVAGCTLYVNRPPCSACSLLVVQAGITRVVARLPLDEAFMSRWGESLRTTRDLFDEAHVEYVEALDARV